MSKIYQYSKVYSIISNSFIYISLSFFIIHFLINFSALASRNELNDCEQLPHHTSFSFFERLDDEITVVIGSYLFNRDFKEFTLANKKIRVALMSHKPFFPDNEILNEMIRSTKISELNRLSLLLSRIPGQKLLGQLEEISKNYSIYDCKIEKENLKKLKYLWKNFKNFIKIKNIEWHFNTKSEELSVLYKKLLRKSANAQIIYGTYDEEGEFSVLFCQFYSKILAFLGETENTEYRECLLGDYFWQTKLPQPEKAERYQNYRSNIKLVSSD